VHRDGGPAAAAGADEAAVRAGLTDRDGAEALEDPDHLARRHALNVGLGSEYVKYD
jgi:hypothetical protein